MARHLIDAGYNLTVCHRTKEPDGCTAKAGARVASTPSQAVENAEILSSRLADDHAIEEGILTLETLSPPREPGIVRKQSRKGGVSRGHAA